MVIDSGKEDCSQTIYVRIRNTNSVYFLPLGYSYVDQSVSAAMQYLAMDINWTF